MTPPWLRSEENVHDLGTSRSHRSSGHVSGVGQRQWPVTLCGRTNEIAGDWWARFVAGNERIRLEELVTHWVPVECISGFSSHTPSSCTN